MKFLFIGDIFGKKGIQACQERIKKIKSQYKIDVVIANAENCTSCRGLSIADYQLLSQAGIDYFTMGNHTWKQKDWEEMLKQNNVVRPININPSCPQASVGVGTLVFKYKNTSVRLTNILGNTVYMNDENFLTNSFASLKALLPAVKEDIHIVDLHAETTSEKNAFLSEFSGQVSAILGTHTHVQTNDQKIYNNTVYITDVGMTGPSHGIIGGEPSSIIEMFEGKSHRFKLNEDNSSYQFNAVVLEFDKKNKPIDIKNIVIYEK